MSFLILEDGEVNVTDEGKSLPALQHILNKDKSVKKGAYHDIINGIYFIYKPDGLYANLSTSQRKLIVYEKGHIKKPWANYENDKNVKSLIDTYLKTSVSAAQLFLENIKNDMDAFVNYLSEIPMSKNHWIDKDVEVDIGEGEKRVVRVQKKIPVSNIEEKQNAYTAALKIAQLYEKQLQIVQNEVAEKKAKIAQRRHFDKRGVSVPFDV